jgi:putative transposase
VFTDETHSSLEPIITRTWAEKGKTPLVKVPNRKKGDRVSLIGGLTEDGRMILLYTQDSMNGLGFVEFMRRVLEQICGKVVIYADNAKIHKSKVVKEFVEANQERLALEFIPPYAPECNPIELVWGWVKNLLAMRVLPSIQALLEFWGMVITIGVFLGLFTHFFKASEQERGY